MAQLVVNDYNLGTDLDQVILIPDAGQQIPINRIGHLEEMNFSQNTTENTITPVLYKGKRLHRNIYHDWSGELVVTRFNNDMTSLIVDIVHRFQTTGLETYFTLYATFRAAQGAGGAQEEMSALRCVIGGHKIGPFTGTAEVKAPFTFRCQDLILPNSRNVLLNGPSVA